MPVYVYKCTQCDETVEYYQKATDLPITHCPSCGGELKKQYSVPTIHFKGSGFYSNDKDTR